MRAAVSPVARRRPGTGRGGRLRARPDDEPEVALGRYTGDVLLRDLPPRARWYIIAVIALAAVAFALLIPRASSRRSCPSLSSSLLSSLTSAFKVQFPIASGSNMSVSYVVDIAALILRGPHATMIVGAPAAGASRRSTRATRNPVYRTLFNMACLVLTVQAAGQVFQLLGGTATADLGTMVVPVAGMALTYFLVNTVPIAIAIALTTNQSAWQVWKTDFASSARQLPARRRRRGGRDRRDRELGLLADAAARRPAALPDLQGVPGRRGERSAAGRDSRSGARRHRHDGSAPEHPRVQSGRRADVRLPAHEHSRPARRPAAAGARAAGASSALEQYTTSGRGPLPGGSSR